MSQVYIIEASNGLLKIGVSNHPHGRLATLRTALPYDLRVARTWPHHNAYQIERAAHEALLDFRVKREWFNATVEQAIAAIEHAIATTNVVMLAPPPQADPAADWVLANTAWNIERSRRIRALKDAGQEMTREQQRQWLEDGGMDDYPPPPRPWVA